ncbi:MAG: alpha/beta hydrolase [Clostridia bacterium]|nr:alpha/beta hydrolase [Clostridia bacterium]
MSNLYPSAHRGETHVPLLDETRFDEIMVQTVESLLQRYRNKGFLTLVRGKRLHYEYYLCSDPLGAVVLCHGFTESAEKYREMTYYFLEAGYSVFLYDQRGHGKSYREIKNPNLIHLTKFQHYADDLDWFLQKIVRPKAVNLPLYLIGHSMGGAVAGLYLSQHPVTFRRAILCAPMISPKTRNMPAFLAEIASLFMCLTGNGKKRVMDLKDFNEDATWEHSSDLSPQRFDYYHQKRIHYRHLQTSAPTYGWMYQALAVTRTLLNRSNCARVQAPVLLLQADTETFVHQKPQEKYAERIPHGELVKLPETKHGIFSSPNEILQPVLDQILSFMSK